MIYYTLMHLDYLFYTSQLLDFIIANNNEGAHVNQITARVSEHGYRAGDIKNAINNLCNEGHIYNTIDENNFQYAE